jgi:hypothetical protein
MMDRHRSRRRLGQRRRQQEQRRRRKGLLPAPLPPSEQQQQEGQQLQGQEHAFNTVFHYTPRVEATGIPKAVLGSLVRLYTASDNTVLWLTGGRQVVPMFITGHDLRLVLWDEPGRGPARFRAVFCLPDEVDGVGPRERG